MRTRSAPADSPEQPPEQTPANLAGDTMTSTHARTNSEDNTTTSNSSTGDQRNSSPNQPPHNSSQDGSPSDEELAEATKTYKSLKRRTQLMKMKQRIAQLEAEMAQAEQATPGESTNATSHTMEAASGQQDPMLRISQPQGQKRPRAETIDEMIAGESANTQLPVRNAPGQSTSGPVNFAGPAIRADDDGGRPPPEPAKSERYHGNSMREHIIWGLRMNNRFYRYPRWFASEDRKVADGVAHLDDQLVLKWMDHVDRTHPEQTWGEFTTFLRDQLDNMENIEQDAQQRYTDARQREGQTVRDFSAYLNSWVNMFGQQISDTQRVEGLRTRILSEVRQEAKRYPEPPTDYDAYVNHLQMVENGMKHRQDAMEKYRKQKARTQRTSQGHGNNGRPGNSNQSSNTSNQRKDSTTRNDQPSKRTRYDGSKTCAYCQRRGHREDECFTKKRDQRSAGSAEDTSKN